MNLHFSSYYPYEGFLHERLNGYRQHHSMDTECLTTSPYDNILWPHPQAQHEQPHHQQPRPQSNLATQQTPSPLSSAGSVTNTEPSQVITTIHTCWFYLLLYSFMLTQQQIPLSLIL